MASVAMAPSPAGRSIVSATSKTHLASFERMRPAAERTAARYSTDRSAGALEAAYLR
jgi:hypothetical protein